MTAAHTDALNTAPGRPAILRPNSMPSVDRGGGNRTVPLVTRAVGSSQMLSGITVIGPGSAIPVHHHNCEETVIVLEGSGFAEIGDEIHAVAASDTSWIPPGLPHRFRNGSAEAPLTIFWVYASVDATRTLAATGETHPISAEHVRPAAYDKKIGQLRRIGSVP